MFMARCTHVRLTVCVLKDDWANSGFRLLQIKLLRTLWHRFLYERSLNSSGINAWGCSCQAV